MSAAQNGGVRRRYRARVVRAVENVKGMLKGECVKGMIR